MMVYADTCILLSLFFRDTHTDAALRWLTEASSETLVITPWTRAEFASAAGILARRGDISPTLHREALERFDHFVTSRLSVEAVATADFDRAGQWMCDYRTGLRAGDALHLAVCVRLNAQVCTADESLIRVARSLGLTVRSMEAD